MISRVTHVVLCFLVFTLHQQMTNAAKQTLLLSESYLPVAMQVIAHLTDQMAYESPDEPVKTTVTPKPSYVDKKTTRKPPVTMTTLQQTTPYHKPGLFAPVVPPTPDKSRFGDQTFLLPLNPNSPYTVIGPKEKPNSEKLLSIEDHEIKPIVDPKPEEPLLPPAFPDTKHSRNVPDSFFIDDEMITDEELQYLSPDLKEMLIMAHGDDDDKLIDVIDDVRTGDDKNIQPKAKPTATNLRLLLLYDLLSRDAKKQRLSDYTGYSQRVMNELIESADGGARAQLSFALSRMLERHDCTHDYANNRAREMIAELAKDDTSLSNEIRYLQPLVYRI